MKKIFLIGILVFVLIQLSISQIAVEPESFTRYGLPDELDIDYEVHVTNLGTDTLHLFWGKRLNNAPNTWWAWVCDINQCYIPEANSCDEDLPNVIAPGASIPISTHIRPWNVEGTGQVELILLDSVGNFLGEVLGTYIVSLTSGTNDINNVNQIYAYPNPAQTSFQLTSFPEMRYVDVYDAYGKQVKSFDASIDGSYYIGDLPAGLFIVNAASASRQIIQTVRLSVN